MLLSVSDFPAWKWQGGQHAFQIKRPFYYSDYYFSFNALLSFAPSSWQHQKDIPFFLFLRSHTRVGQKSCRLLHHFALFIYSSTFTWLPPSLSFLTAGWKNGWQKSVREQIENKLPSHFHFSVLMLLLAHFILCQLASSPECSPNKQKKKKRKWSKGKKKKKNKNKCKYQMNILHRWRYTQPRKSERYK